jgi:hypothetical protein
MTDALHSFNIRSMIAAKQGILGKKVAREV